MDELKDCPFCGGKAELYFPAMMPNAWVICSKCGISTPMQLAFSLEEAKERAIYSWNRRAKDELD